MAFAVEIAVGGASDNSSVLAGIAAAIEMCRGILKKRSVASASAPSSKPSKQSLQPAEADFEEVAREYVKSIRLLRKSAVSLVKKPTSKRRLDAVLQARVREVEARRAYQKASKALFEAVLSGS